MTTDFTIDNICTTVKVFQQRFHKASHKLLREQCNHKSFTVNFNKTLQQRKIPTMNDLHCTVYSI